MAHWAGLPEFVRESRLEAQVYVGLTIHSVYDSLTGSLQQQQWNRDMTFRVGRGGQGKVWLERRFYGPPSYHTLQRAVKEIELDIPIDRDEDRLRELEALAKFSRPRYREFIIESYGWYLKNENLLCIAMEYCKLGDLAHYLESNGRLTEKDAKIITTQVLVGLNFMHDEGWAHRDLKLSNILITRQPPERWGVKISDLGLSKRTQAHLYDSTTVKGTPGLLAPELAGFMGTHASRTANPKSIDMWCLGGTVYEMVTGRKPFADLSLFSTYCNGRRTISKDSLVGHASPILVDFIQSLMWVEPRSRLDVAKARQHQWIKDTPLPTSPPSQDPISSLSKPKTPVQNTTQHPIIQPQPSSGSWSTGSGFQPASFLPQTPTLGIPFRPAYVGSGRGYYPQYSSQYPLTPSLTFPYTYNPYYIPYYSPNPYTGPTHRPTHRVTLRSPRSTPRSRQHYPYTTTPLQTVTPNTSSPTNTDSSGLQNPPAFSYLQISKGSTSAKSQPKPTAAPTDAHGRPESSQPPKQVSSTIRDKETKTLVIGALAKKPQGVTYAHAARKLGATDVKNDIETLMSKDEISGPLASVIDAPTKDPAKRATLEEESKQRRTSSGAVTSITKHPSTSTTKSISNHRELLESHHGVSTSKNNSNLGDLGVKRLIDIGKSRVGEQSKDYIELLDMLEGSLQNSDWQIVEKKKKKKRNRKGLETEEPPAPQLIK
ncbi:kinase-like domain-containing protein [Xylaria telfairii]|nr:kinase-like domain-containing protein [Xylaria telfairii]